MQPSGGAAPSTAGGPRRATRPRPAATSRGRVEPQATQPARRLRRREVDARSAPASRLPVHGPHRHFVGARRPHVGHFVGRRDRDERAQPRPQHVVAQHRVRVQPQSRSGPGTGSSSRASSASGRSAACPRPAGRTRGASARPAGDGPSAAADASVRANSPTLAPRGARLSASQTSSALSIDVAVTADLPFHYTERCFNIECIGRADGCQGTEMVGFPVQCALRAIGCRCGSRGCGGRLLGMWLACSAAGATAAIPGNARSRARHGCSRRLRRPPAPTSSTDRRDLEIARLAAELTSAGPGAGAWSLAAHPPRGARGVRTGRPLRPCATGAAVQRQASHRSSAARWRQDGQRRAYTLVSPYPDATLSRIVDGTMVIEFQVTAIATRSRCRTP